VSFAGVFAPGGLHSALCHTFLIMCRLMQCSTASDIHSGCCSIVLHVYA